MKWTLSAFLSLRVFIYKKSRGGGTMIQLGNEIILTDKLDSELPESVSILVLFFGKKAIILVA